MLNRAVENVLPLRPNTSRQFVCLCRSPPSSPLLRSTSALTSALMPAFKPQSQVEPALLPFVPGNAKLARKRVGAAAQWSRALCAAYFCESEGAIAGKCGKLNCSEEAQML